MPMHFLLMQTGYHSTICIASYYKFNVNCWLLSQVFIGLGSSAYTVGIDYLCCKAHEVVATILCRVHSEAACRTECRSKHAPRPGSSTMQLVHTTAYCKARIVLVFSILPTVSGPVNSCQRLIKKRVEKRA